MSKHNLPKHNPSFVILTSSTHAALVMWLLSWLCQQKCYLCTWTEKCFETLINRVVEAFAGLLNYFFFLYFFPLVHMNMCSTLEILKINQIKKHTEQWGPCTWAATFLTPLWWHEFPCCAPFSQYISYSEWIMFPAGDRRAFFHHKPICI